MSQRRLYKIGKASEYTGHIIWRLDLILTPRASVRHFVPWDQKEVVSPFKTHSGYTVQQWHIEAQVYFTRKNKQTNLKALEVTITTITVHNITTKRDVIDSRIFFKKLFCLKDGGCTVQKESSLANYLFYRDQWLVEACSWVKGKKGMTNFYI